MRDTFTRRELLDAGWTGPALTAAVARGTLVRVRRGHYAHPDTDEQVVRAVRVGGRLACLSELRYRGVWVPELAATHVHLGANASRLRDPDDRHRPLAPDAPCVLHWAPLAQPETASASHVSVADALLQAARCADRRLAVAAIDSALHQRLITLAELQRLAPAMAESQRLLFAESDARAESGLESIVRTIARDLGLRVSIQERFPGVGRLDLVIEDWIVVETDGDAYHDVLVLPRDRRRDARLAADGRATLRFRYAQVMFEQRAVALALIGMVRSHRRIRNSGSLAARAMQRLETLHLT